MLNHETPACFAGAPAVTLQPNNQLLKLVSGENLGLSSKSQSLRTPPLGALGGLGKIRHTCLARGERFEDMPVRNQSFRNFELSLSRRTEIVSTPNRVETSNLLALPLGNDADYLGRDLSWLT
jgi:hypothetical protein